MVATLVIHVLIYRPRRDGRLSCYFCYSGWYPLTLMRSKSRFFAVLRPQRTAGNRGYTAKTAKEPLWPQSERKPSARQPQPSAKTKILVKPYQNRGLDRVSGKGCVGWEAVLFVILTMLYCIMVELIGIQDDFGKFMTTRSGPTVISVTVRPRAVHAQIAGLYNFDKWNR